MQRTTIAELFGITEQRMKDISEQIGYGEAEAGTIDGIAAMISKIRDEPNLLDKERQAFIFATGIVFERSRVLHKNLSPANTDLRPN